MRWVIRVIVIVLLLSVAALAGFLGPAHLQIRAIEPALPTEAELRALANVPDGPIAIRIAQSSSQSGAERVLGHSVVILEWADGRRFMIDAAMDQQASDEFGELVARMSPGMEPANYHGNVADLLGAKISTVHGVGFTHLHTDHVQGIHAFCAARGPGARSYQTVAQATQHNLHTKEGAEQLASSCLEPSVLDGDGLLSVSEFPGLGIVALGGHTPGSTLFAAHVDGTLWLMSGDISNVKSKLMSNTGKGWLYSTLFVPENTARTEELRLWLSALDRQANAEVIVAHDFAAALDSGMLPLQTGNQ